MNPIKPGKYVAKIVNYGVFETKAGDPVVKILFEFNDEVGRRELTWSGFLSEKATPHTMKALLTCGLRGNDIAGLIEGVSSNLLDVDNPVQIDVQLEPGRNDPTKAYATIRWINRLGGAGFGSVVKPETKARLSTFKGAVMSARAEHGIKDPGPAAKQPAQGFSNRMMFTEDDVGF